MPNLQSKNTILSPYEFVTKYLSCNENINLNEKFVILRFVAWDASHDFGHSGLDYSAKKKLVIELSRYAKVFISSEGELPEELKQFQLKISPDMMHDVLAYTSLCIGEGGTTANECACLGTPNILVNSLLKPETIPGLHLELKSYGLQFLFDSYNEKVLSLAKEILQSDKIRRMFKIRRSKLLKDKIDVTSFLVKFIENYANYNCQEIGRN